MGYGNWTWQDEVDQLNDGYVDVEMERSVRENDDLGYDDGSDEWAEWGGREDAGMNWEVFGGQYEEPDMDIYAGCYSEE